MQLGLPPKLIGSILRRARACRPPQRSQHSNALPKAVVFKTTSETKPYAFRASPSPRPHPPKKTVSLTGSYECKGGGVVIFASRRLKARDASERRGAARPEHIPHSLFHRK